MKLEQSKIQRHCSQVTRDSHILRIKSTLKSIPIISRNFTKIHKKMSLRTDYSASSQSQSFSIQNQQDLNVEAIQHTQLFLQKYDLKEKIGEGSNGVVHRCVKKRTNQVYAVKSFMFDDQQLLELKLNFLMMKKLNHPSIIFYQSLYIDLTRHAGWLVMELVQAPSLSKIYIQGQNQLRHIFQQIVQALNYIHRRIIAHRDIKLQNILFDAENKRIKIIDFGICKKYRKKSIKFDMLTITGTLYYRAPEILLGGGYNEKIDIWAAGILLYKLVEGHTPFESSYQAQTIHNILHSQVQFSEKFDRFSPLLKQLILRMLKRQPKQRLSAYQILKDAWLYAIPSHLHHHKGSYHKVIEEDCQGLINNKEVKFQQFKSYTCEINGDKYHCIDSDKEDLGLNLKKKKKSSFNVEYSRNLI